MIDGADKFEVYAEFGLAAETGQTLEVEVGNFCLAYIGLFFKPDQITDEHREMLRSVVNDLNRKTLGKLVKMIKTSATFDQTFLAVVEAALERRNYLIHHFLRSNNLAINSVEGRRTMIAELKKIQGELSLALAHLSAASSALLGLTGCGESIDERVQKIIKDGWRIKI
jgi:hypothetical protein